MRKILLILLILFVIPLYGFCKEPAAVNISEIENSIFGYEYAGDNDSVRLERIENYIYGSKKSGTIQTRLKNIQNDIGFSNVQQVKEKPENADYIPSEIQPKDKKAVQNHDVMNLKEDSSVEYPIVDEMEKEIFKTTYKEENIYKRLDRLETKVFNKTTNDALNERVERLSMLIKPSKKTKPEQTYTSQELDDYYATSGLESITDETMPFQLSVLEEGLLKNNYERDNIANRLSRLEQKLFKRTFSDDNDISRLQRIMVAYDAKQNSYKYENNKRMQNMATVSQIGGILLMILAILL